MGEFRLWNVLKLVAILCAIAFGIFQANLWWQGRQAQKILAEARQLREAGNSDLAIKRLQEVLDHYPRTGAAIVANEMQSSIMVEETKRLKKLGGAVRSKIREQNPEIDFVMEGEEGITLPGETKIEALPAPAASPK